MTDETAAAVITAQTQDVAVGEKSYTLKPRTLAQMRAISKAIAEYSDGVYIGVESLKSAKSDEIDSAVRSEEHTSELVTEKPRMLSSA